MKRMPEIRSQQDNSNAGLLLFSIFLAVIACVLIGVILVGTLR